MKRKPLTIILFLVFGGYATSATNEFPRDDTLSSLIGTFYVSYHDTFYAGKTKILPVLHNHIRDLRCREASFENRSDYIEFIFDETHKIFLKDYRQFSTLSEIISTGNYDCVSASALYAILFEILKIPYSIHETEYHIFIEIEDFGSHVLLETTDPDNGFINDEEQIIRMKDLYRKEGVKKSDPLYYRFKARINNEINIHELAGLQLYNLAVNQFNQQNYELAQKLLDRALMFYSSDRLREIKVLFTSL